MKFVAIDVGNTRTKVGLFEDGKLLKVWAVETSNIGKILELDVPSFGVASCVVPEVKPFLNRHFELVFLNSQNAPLEVDYVSEPGADRLAAAIYASNLSDDANVVCIGTAVFFDRVFKRKFLGGAILPGPELMTQSLCERTSLIEKTPFKPEFEFPAKSTASCVNLGATASVVGAVDFLLSKSDAKETLLCGGAAAMFKEHIKHDYFEENAVLLGLALFLENYCRQ